MNSRAVQGSDLPPFLLTLHQGLISFCSCNIHIGQKAIGPFSKEKPELKPLSSKCKLFCVVEISPFLSIFLIEIIFINREHLEESKVWLLN